jgi:type 1 fimbriae regulatory protein FimB
VWVSRLKNSLSVEQPIAGDELRAIKRYLATRTDKLPWLFVSERGQPFTRSAVNYLVRVAGKSAGLKNVHAPQPIARRRPQTWENLLEDPRPV